jgi:hypothetical protein
MPSSQSASPLDADSAADPSFFAASTAVLLSPTILLAGVLPALGLRTCISKTNPDLLQGYRSSLPPSPGYKCGSGLTV